MKYGQPSIYVSSIHCLLGCKHPASLAYTKKEEKQKGRKGKTLNEYNAWYTHVRISTHAQKKKAKIRKRVSKRTGTKTNRGQHEYTKMRQPIGPLLPLPPHRLRMPERSEQTHSSTGTYEGDWKGTNTQIYRKVGLRTVAG